MIDQGALLTGRSVQ